MKDPFEIYQDSINYNVIRNEKRSSALHDITNIESVLKRPKNKYQQSQKDFTSEVKTKTNIKHYRQPKSLHFELLENRGLERRFDHISGQSINSTDPIVSKCENDMKLIINWFKLNKFEYVSKPKEGQSFTQKNDTTFLNAMLRSTDKYEIKATHVIEEIDQVGNAYLCKVTDRIREKKVILIYLNQVELAVGDEVNLGNVHHRQDGIEYYLKWEKVI